MDTAWKSQQSSDELLAHPNYIIGRIDDVAAGHLTPFTTDIYNNHLVIAGN